MRKMRIKDDSTGLISMGGYLFCNKKRNKPRVYYKICEGCQYKEKCVDYNTFLIQAKKDQESSLKEKSVNKGE